MDTEHLLPMSKEDLDFITNLRLKSISEIRIIIPQLLEWTQDINWPQTSLIVNYLSSHINEIQEELISILKSNDEVWKYSILHGLIFNSSNIPSDKILLAIRSASCNASLLIPANKPFSSK